MTPRPFLRYNGGKRYRLKDLTRILQGFPAQDYHYIEPMVGGGATFFALSPEFKTSAIGDISSELINLYKVVKSQYYELIAELDSGDYWYTSHTDQASKTNYHKIRALEPESPVQRAARWYYLNRTSINGLMRTNKDGKMNAAPGDVRCFQPNTPLLSACSIALQRTAIYRGEAQTILTDVLEPYKSKKIFLLVDPPYHDEKPGKYTSYAGGFTEEDQRKLVEGMLNSGHKFIYTNKATPFVLGLFPSWVVQETFPLVHKVGPEKCRGVVEQELVAYYLG